MARYVYRCAPCARQFEVEKAMARAAEPEACPTCGLTAERVFTAPGLSQKGGEGSFQDSGSRESPEGCEGCCHSGECDLD